MKDWEYISLITTFYDLYYLYNYNTDYNFNAFYVDIDWTASLCNL